MNDACHSSIHPQVVMSDSGVFEVYGVGHDLGLEELCQHCEDHIATTMTPHNACTFLMAALKMEQRTGGEFRAQSYGFTLLLLVGLYVAFSSFFSLC